jgi:carbonic anhydrase
VTLELFHSYAGDPTLRYQMPDTKLFLARLDRRVAGCVAIDAFNAETLEIHRLFVDPVFRGRGVARALMDRTLTHAAITQSNLVVLQTATFMAAAIDLYRSLGFAPCKPFRPSSPAVAFLDVFMSRAIVR